MFEWKNFAGLRSQKMSKIAPTPSQKPEISVPPQRAEINPEYEDDEEEKGQKVTLIKVISRPAQGAWQSLSSPRPNF